MMAPNVFAGAVNRSVPLVDCFAITLSGLCFAHCLFMPILLIALPSLGIVITNNEAIHQWLILAVIPTSLFALFMGCKQHQRKSFLAIAIGGLSFLVFGILVESLQLGISDYWGLVFTVIGTLLIAYAHVRNYRLCRKAKNCKC